MFDTDYSKWKYWQMKKYNYKKALKEKDEEIAKLDEELARLNEERAGLEAQISKKIETSHTNLL